MPDYPTQMTPEQAAEDRDRRADEQKRLADERHRLNLLRPFVLAALPEAMRQADVADADGNYCGNIWKEAAAYAYAVAEECLAEERRRLDDAMKGPTP